MDDSSYTTNGFSLCYSHATPTDSTESFQEDHGMISYTQSICTLFNTESLGTMRMSHQNVEDAEEEMIKTEKKQ